MEFGYFQRSAQVNVTVAIKNCHITEGLRFHHASSEGMPKQVTEFSVNLESLPTFPASSMDNVSVCSKRSLYNFAGMFF